MKNLQNTAVPKTDCDDILVTEKHECVIYGKTEKKIICYDNNVLILIFRIFPLFINFYI